VEASLAEDRGRLLSRVDDLLGQSSWDAAWARIERLLDGVLSRRGAGAPGR
jgi:UDP-galactopyranose mutase